MLAFHGHLTGWNNQLNHILWVSNKLKKHLNLEITDTNYKTIEKIMLAHNNDKCYSTTERRG